QGQKPGPAYLDLPGDVLYRKVEHENVPFPPAAQPGRAAGDPDQIERALDLLRKAERPIIVSGSGVVWSGAEQEYAEFVARTGIPFFTTPQSRGVIAEDDDLAFLGARTTAFTQADLVLLLGTRTNFIIGYAQSPRFAADAKFVMVNSDAS